jgi:hypothetical protein
MLQDVGLWLEEINLGSYRQSFEENGVNGEYLESLSMFTTEQILRFIRRCHMKWGDFITLCKELRRIKGSNLSCLLLFLHFRKSSHRHISILWLPSQFRFLQFPFELAYHVTCVKQLKKCFFPQAILLYLHQFKYRSSKNAPVKF